MNLRAVVIGAGWAGEGHTTALRASGVEVVAMCGRTPEPATAMAAKLGIPHLRFDWRQALLEFQPEIVAIGTPAGPHCEMAKTAAHLGCHILCDKPLGTNAAEAQEMLSAVEQAGVKHAYATTSRYAPALFYSRTLLANGLIGQVREIESSAHSIFSPRLAYHWVHQLSQGGGLLNNLFTHKIGQVLYLTGGTVRAAAGEAQRLIDRAPVGPTLHDFRDLFSPSAVVSPEQAQAGTWREVDSDGQYTVMVQLQMPEGHLASAVFLASTAAANPYPDYLALYGSKGTLHLTGPNAPDHIQHYDLDRQVWDEIAVPQEVIDSFPQVADFVQRDWNQFFSEFVADIRGEGYMGYPTFRDGWLAAEIIDIARSGRSWTTLAMRPDDSARGGKNSRPGS